MPAFKGVIFDLFHTLTARESQWSDVPATWSLLGVDRYDWDRAMLQSSRWRLVGEERDPYVIFRRLVSLCDASIPDDRVREVLVRRTQRFTECFQRVPAENVGMLKRLRASGYKLALLSNADAMEVTAYAAGNLQGLFDVEVFSCDAGHVKPEPEIFHSCLEALELPASQCVFVGDGGSGELQGAQAVGLRTILVSGVIEELFPERLPERIAVADRYVKWAHEVDGLIENWAPACRGVTPHG